MVAKIFYSKEDGQELAVESTVFLLALVRVLDQEAMGHQRSSRNCSSCPPIALPDVSTVILVFVFQWG